jgi:hypothetical protein
MGGKFLRAVAQIMLAKVSGWGHPLKGLGIDLPPFLGNLASSRGNQESTFRGTLSYN